MMRKAIIRMSHARNAMALALPTHSNRQFQKKLFGLRHNDDPMFKSHTKYQFAPETAKTFLLHQQYDRNNELTIHCVATADRGKVLVVGEGGGSAAHPKASDNRVTREY